MKIQEGLVQRRNRAEVQLAGPFWRRAVWMRLGALNGLVAFLIFLLSDQSMVVSGQIGLVRQAAQVQFMHGMATLACATFMNVGAGGARLAPGFFLSGVGLYCLPIYLEAIGVLGPAFAIKQIGLVAFVVGWLILAWSARDIDKV
jgi:uncharacterized membrane protein YgdD (TMEM256/DUF423 family)